MNLKNELKPLRRKLIGHGALLIFAGGILGFGFLFFLLGHITVWPIPGELQFQMPGKYDAWRMAHMEAIVNGALIWLLAAVLPLLPFSSLRGLRLTSYAMVIVAWTFVIASTIKLFFANSRGLEATGLLSNNIVFGLFYVGVALVMIVMATIAWKSLRGEKSGSA